MISFSYLAPQINLGELHFCCYVLGTAHPASEEVVPCSSIWRVKILESRRSNKLVINNIFSLTVPLCYPTKSIDKNLPKEDMEFKNLTNKQTSPAEDDNILIFP